MGGRPSAPASFISGGIRRALLRRGGERGRPRASVVAVRTAVMQDAAPLLPGPRPRTSSWRHSRGTSLRSVWRSARIADRPDPPRRIPDSCWRYPIGTHRKSRPGVHHELHVQQLIQVCRNPKHGRPLLQRLMNARAASVADHQFRQCGDLAAGSILSTTTPSPNVSSNASPAVATATRHPRATTAVTMSSSSAGSPELPSDT